MSDDPMTTATAVMFMEQRDAAIAERDRYRAALESIVEMECFATLAEARVAREALSSEAGKR